MGNNQPSFNEGNIIKFDDEEFNRNNSIGLPEEVLNFYF